MTLVERGSSVRSFHIDGTRVGDLLPIIRANISREARLMTDERSSYNAEIEGLTHDSVNHSKEEYVRGEVNTVEGYYSTFKCA
jgi:hypothetical protein